MRGLLTRLLPFFRPTQAPSILSAESPGWAYRQYPQANVLAQDRIDIMHQKQVLIRDHA
jgi:hypothetical protein